MFAIFKKELRAYFINPIGYVYTGVFLAVAALLCAQTTIRSATYDTSLYFQYLIFSFVVLLPLLTMRLLSEERRTRTEQLLLTAPVSITGMVFGKYLAALALFAATLVVSCLNFFPLSAYALVERSSATSDTHIGPVAGEVVGCLIGVLLIGAAFIAIGLFISSLTESQLSAAVTTIAVLVGMLVVGLLGSSADSVVVRTVTGWISMLSRFEGFSLGIFDFAAVVYYLSIIGVFLFLSVRVYEKRRWG